jgi:methyl-accepting chemotaxis protein
VSAENGIEYVLTDQDLIVSKTDLKGIITFVNDDLTRISGYSTEELIGSSHNIFRHSDMPKEAFSDMWETIKAGHSWSGLVKNKTKSGGFYWVRAHITAIYDNEKIIGYMSVRRKPKVENVAFISQIYKDINSSNFKGKIQRGLLVKNGIFQKLLRLFGNATLKDKFLIFSLCATLGLAVILYLGLLFISGGTITKCYPLIGFIFVFALTGAGILFWGIKHYVLEPLRYAADSLNKISQGDYFLYMDYYADNEIGTLMEAIRNMSVRLGFAISDARKKENEYLRLKIGLDNAATALIVTNQEKEIVYLNETSQSMLDNIQAHLKLTQNKQAKIGEKFHLLNFFPDVQQIIFNTSKEIKTVQTLIGTRHIHIKVSPIINAFGVYLGAVSEWTDNTDEMKLSNEISHAVFCASNGQFENRISLSSNNVFFNKLSTELNDLLAICEQAFSQFKKIFSNMVQGNLTEKIVDAYQGDFEHLKQDANLAVVQLNDIIFALTQAIEVVTKNGKNISNEINELSLRTENQIIELHNIASSSHSLMSAVLQNDEYAKNTNLKTMDVFKVANQGVNAIENVIDMMSNVQQSSSKISEITTIIDEIAFQTNILAINASIEAARAGEQGKGFAVVATEIQGLAKRVSIAASEITSLVNKSEVEAIKGSQLAQNAGTVIKEISISIEEVISMIKEISTACTHQSYAIEMVDKAICEIENSVKRNINLVVATTESSTHLENEMKALSQTANYFKVKENVVDFELF